MADVSFSEKFNSIPTEDNGLYSLENADAVVGLFKEEGRYYPRVLGTVYDSYIAGGITEGDNISWIGAQAVSWLDNKSKSETYMVKEIDRILDYGTKFKQFIKEDQAHFPGFLQEVENSKQKISDDAQAAWEQWNMIAQNQAEDEKYHPDYEQILQISESLRTKKMLLSSTEEDSDNYALVNDFISQRYWELYKKRGNFSDIDLQDIDILLPHFQDSLKITNQTISDKKAKQESGQDFEFEVIEDLLEKALNEREDLSLDELQVLKEKLNSYTDYNWGFYKDKIGERLKQVDAAIKQRQEPENKNTKKQELAQLKKNSEFKYYDPFQLNEQGELAYEVFREDYERFNAVVFTDDDGKALEGEELEKARKTLKETILYEAKSKSLAFTGKQEDVNNIADYYYVNIKNSLHKAMFATELAQIQQNKSLDAAAKAEEFKKIVSQDYDGSRPVAITQSSLIQYAGMVNAGVRDIRDRLKAKFGRIPAVKRINQNISDFDGKMKKRYGQKWEISKRISLSIFKSAKNIAVYSAITAMSGTMAPYAMGALAIKNAFDVHRNLKAQAQSENLTFKQFYNRHPGKVWKSYSMAALGGAAAAVGIGTQHFGGSKEAVQGVQKVLPWLTRTMVLAPKLIKTGINVQRLKKAKKNKADAEVIAKLQAKCNECYLETTEAVISVGAGIGLNNLVGGYINKMFVGAEPAPASMPDNTHSASPAEAHTVAEQPQPSQQDVTETQHKVNDSFVDKKVEENLFDRQPENLFEHKTDAVDKMFQASDLGVEISEGTKIEDPSNPYNPHNYKPAESPENTPEAAPHSKEDTPDATVRTEKTEDTVTPSAVDSEVKQEEVIQPEAQPDDKTEMSAPVIKQEEVIQPEAQPDDKTEMSAPVINQDPYTMPNDKALEHFQASFEQEASSYSTTIIDDEKVSSYQLPNQNIKIVEHADSSTTIFHSYDSGAKIEINLNADGSKTETITDAYGEQTVIGYDAEGNRHIQDDTAAKNDEVGKRLEGVYKKLDELNQLKEGETATQTPSVQKPITAQNINTQPLSRDGGGNYYG